MSEYKFDDLPGVVATLVEEVKSLRQVIDECLAHVGDYALTDIYAERDWKRINKAGHKVLDLFTWPK